MNKVSSLNNIEKAKKLRKKIIRRQKIKNIMNKIAIIARQGLEIYSSVKSKDPLSVGLGIVSGYGVITDALSNDKEDVLVVLREMGVHLVSQNFGPMIRRILFSADYPSHICWTENKTEGMGNGQIIEEFVLNNSSVYFYADAGSYVEGPYVKDNEVFFKEISNIIEKNVGKYLMLDTTSATSNGWERDIRLSSIELKDNVYVSHLDEASLLETIQKFFAKKLNRSMLFYGPAGSGKTTLALRLTRALNGSLLVVNGWSLSNRQTGSIFNLINMINPSVILFDDLDRIDDMEALLCDLEQLNNKNGHNRLFIATANDINKIPKALRRPGRFDQAIKFEPPEKEQRKEILSAHAKSNELELNSNDLEILADLTEGMTGAYLKEVVLRVSVLGINEMPEHIKTMKEVSGMFDKKEEGEEDIEEGNGESIEKRLKNILVSSPIRIPIVE